MRFLKAFPPLGVILLAVSLANLRAQDFTTLHVFAGFPAGYRTNWDGADPLGSLAFSGSTFYGTASEGGTNGKGTVFSLNSDGGGFTVLHTFTDTAFPSGANTDGAYPSAGMVLSGNTLYGTASKGGTNGSGTVFSINTNGSNFNVLHTFAPSALDLSEDILTNADGIYPQATLLLSGGVLYGTAEYGGTNGEGAVFSLGTNGTNFNVLCAFPCNEFNDNTNGADPAAGLALVGDTLYGTASDGGTNGAGTVFAINLNSNSFAVAYTFAAEGATDTTVTNSDGGDSQAGFAVWRWHGVLPRHQRLELCSAACLWATKCRRSVAGSRLAVGGQHSLWNGQRGRRPRERHGFFAEHERHQFHRVA
jgi:uncharacterized repeat protein (TIGR03803 family)